MRHHITRQNVLAGTAVALFAGGCLDSVDLPLGNQLAKGTWGGENAGVIVGDSGTHVHIACTFGDLPPGVQLDDDGRFSADGSFVLRAYPIAVGPSLPAHFSGRVVGRMLTLTVAVDDTVEHEHVALGPVSVEFGRTPNMGPCPICRRPRG